MKRLEPNANKQLTRKWREENLHRHYNRLNQTRPQVNCHNTVNFPHLVTKPKKNQLIEERCTEIEKNNMNLFHKMRAIIRTKHTQWRQKNLCGRAELAPRERIGSAFSHGSMRSRGQSAKSNRSNKSFGNNGDYDRRARSRSNQSLRSERKRMEAEQLHESNRKQLRRLQDTKCSFDVLKWSKQEKERQKLIDNLKQYPQKPIAEYMTRPQIKNSYKQKSLAPITQLTGSMNSPRLSRERSRGQRQNSSRGLTPRTHIQHKKTTSVLPNRTRQMPFQVTLNNNTATQYNLPPKRFASTRGKARMKSVRRQRSMQGTSSDLQSYFPPNAYHSQLGQNQQHMYNSSFMPQPSQGQTYQQSMLPPSSFRQIKSSEGSQNPTGLIPSPRSNRPQNRNRQKFISPELTNQLNYNNFLQSQAEQQHQNTAVRPGNVYTTVDSDVTTLRKPSLEQQNRGRTDIADIDNSQRLTPQMLPDRKIAAGQSRKRSKGTANSSYRKQSNDGQMRRITKQEFATQAIMQNQVIKPKENLRQKPPKQIKAEINQPAFMAVMGIPIRSNKQDNDPPHQEFQVVISNYSDTLAIIATNLRDQRDYFEIKVQGQEEVQRVLTKFRFSYLLISESLRIMNEVMVLLNPKMLEKEVAGTITPKLNEQSIDEPLQEVQAEKVDDSGMPSDKGGLSIQHTQTTPPPELN